MISWGFYKEGDLVGLINMVLKFTGIILIGFILGGCAMSKTIDNNLYEGEVKEFSLDDYCVQMDEFPSSLQYQPVNDADTALQIAEKVWLEVYGDHILESKPYEISFDYDNDVWLIMGVLHGEGSVGGVPYMLIEKYSGRVLACWHTV